MILCSIVQVEFLEPTKILKKKMVVLVEIVDKSEERK